LIKRNSKIKPKLKLDTKYQKDKAVTGNKLTQTNDRTTCA